MHLNTWRAMNRGEFRRKALERHHRFAMLVRSVMTDFLKDPKKLAAIAYHVLRGLTNIAGEPSEGDAQMVADRVKRVHAGLNPEKEFFALVSWLGRCAAINSIEDLKMPVPEPDAKELIRPPDFVAVSRHGNHLIPVLIEVKTKDDDKLKWTEGYLSSLQRFAGLLNLPLLVAWKRYGLWTLTDAQHFEKCVSTYHLAFERAMKENLMTEIFGDVMVTLSPEFNFFLDVDIEDAIPETGLIPAGTYRTVIRDAGLRVGEKRLPKSENELFWLFMTCPDENHIERLTGNRVRIVHSPKADSMFPLFQVLLTQLVSRIPEDLPAIDWNEEILKGPLSSSGEQFRQALKNGIDCGAVQYVLQQQPQTKPHFLRN